MIGIAWYMFGCTCSWYRLITGWCMHLFMVQVDYRLMVDALVYGTG
jgi:hypothetical protein